MSRHGPNASEWPSGGRVRSWRKWQSAALRRYDSVADEAGADSRLEIERGAQPRKKDIRTQIAAPLVEFICAAAAGGGSCCVTDFTLGVSDSRLVGCAERIGSMSSSSPPGRGARQRARHLQTGLSKACGGKSARRHWMRPG